VYREHGVLLVEDQAAGLVVGDGYDILAGKLAQTRYL
jgi:hypothetical protein